MAQAVHSYFDTMLAPPPSRSNGINLHFLDLPRVDPAGMSGRFTKEEGIIRALPPNKAPRPDGFTARFLQVAWDII
jgi:hypothetical protein